MMILSAGGVRTMAQVLPEMNNDRRRQFMKKRSISECKSGYERIKEALQSLASWTSSDSRFLPSDTFALSSVCSVCVFSSMVLKFCSLRT